MRFLSLLIALLVFSQAAVAAIVPSIPYNLTNGSLADATQVMGNFNTIVTDVNANGAHSGSNSDITSLTGMTTPLSHAQGGTVQYTCGTTTGSANVQVCASPVPNNFTLTAGYFVTVVAGFTNSAATTLNANGTGATAVKKIISSGLTDVASGDIVTNGSYTFFYDGTQYQLLNPTTGTLATLTSQIDTAFGSTQGDILFRSASAWKVLNHGTSGQFLQTAGAGANPLWAGAVTYNAIAGFTPSSIAGAATTATMTIAAGQAADLNNAAYITNASTESWAVSNGNAINGYSGGTTLPNSSTIHMYECSGSSGVGSYAIPNASYPLAAASCPTGYTSYARRAFSFTTTGAGAPIPYASLEISAGQVVNYLTTQVLDINASQGTARTLYALSVPLGIKVQPLVRITNDNASTNYTNIIITSGDETDVAPAATGSLATPWSAVPGSDIFGVGGPVSIFTGFLTTNTSAQIGARASAAAAGLHGVTRGWIDFRRN